MVDYNYGNLSRISSVPNSRPDGYLLRFPFYAIATHDVHVTFTTSEHPNYGSDAAYEIGEQKTHGIAVVSIFDTHIFQLLVAGTMPNR